jgi:hypothetical protein
MRLGWTSGLQRDLNAAPTEARTLALAGSAGPDVSLAGAGAAA